jgi:hypothetical protein
MASIDTRTLSELMWPSELTPEFLLRYKIIYISYGSMDFQSRAKIYQGEIVQTFQNHPAFLRMTSDCPYLCISIDDYRKFTIFHKNHDEDDAPYYEDKLKYTFIQIPSSEVSDIKPITDKLVSMLDEIPLPQLYICNFIKFMDTERYARLENEGNNISTYLGKYSPYFYQWLGYSLSYKDTLIQYRLVNWLYKQDCNLSLKKIKDRNDPDCFIDITQF